MTVGSGYNNLEERENTIMKWLLLDIVCGIGIVLLLMHLSNKGENNTGISVKLHIGGLIVFTIVGIFAFIKAVGSFFSFLF